MIFVYVVLFFVLAIFSFTILGKDKKNKWIYALVSGIVNIIILVTINTFFMFPSDYITIRALNEKDAASEAVNITMQSIKDKNDNILNYKVIKGKWLDTAGEQRWG